MKLAFSTIGCPEWTFDEIFAVANDLRYDGVEIRGIGRQMYAPQIKQLTDGSVERKKQKTGLEVCCLASGATFAMHDKKDESLAEAKAYIDLAEQLSVPYVRIMSTDKPYYDGGDVKLCEKLFAEIVKYAENTSVTPLMETNGLFIDTALLKSFLLTTGGGALWDIHHPYRFGGETIEQSYKNLSGLVKHVHVKDSVVENGKTAYRIVGHGDVPIKTAVDYLKTDGFDGYLTMEWVKRWHKELEEPGVVLAHYPFFMRRYIK